MENDEVVKVEWIQLSQRSIWGNGDGKSRSGSKKQSLVMGGNMELRPYTSPPKKQPGFWEYLDHTADIQIHSTGSNLGEAFAAAAVGMFGYMVELDEISTQYEIDVTANAHDIQSLLFNFLDECLYIFHTESFVMKEIVFKDFNMQDFTVTVLARGGKFDATKHSQGTEVKAITYSNMQVVDDGCGKAEVFVIVDI